MKKSYKGFPVYLLIILVVFAVAQMFTSSMTSQAGVRIEYSELLNSCAATSTPRMMSSTGIGKPRYDFFNGNLQTPQRGPRHK